MTNIDDTASGWLQLMQFKRDEIMKKRIVFKRLRHFRELNRVEKFPWSVDDDSWICVEENMIIRLHELSLNFQVLWALPKFVRIFGEKIEHEGRKMIPLCGKPNDYRMKIINSITERAILRLEREFWWMQFKCLGFVFISLMAFNFHFKSPLNSLGATISTF